MSSKWKNRLLSEIVEINPKRTIKKGETTPFIDMAALPINSRDVDVAICSREYKGGGSKFQNGDTLVARITPCLENGKTALINCLSNNTIAHGSTEFIVLAARDQREFQFVYYLARSDPFRSYAIARMEGTSGRQRVPNTAVGDYEFFCPPADQRVAIGRFLANLDDRITLLRETNKTLETIAQAIFKSWFVDFDPVRAKMEGRQPEGMDEATAALFPDSFEESELGLVPKGWTPLYVSQAADLVKGKSYSSKDLVNSHDTALVTLKSFARGGGFRMDGFKPYSGTYKPNQIVSPGDLIVAYTDVTQAAELIGKPAIVVGIDSYTTLVASLDVGIIRPNESICGRQFLYNLFRTDSFQSHALAHTSGTTVLHLAKEGVGSFRFAYPKPELTHKFEVITSSFAEQRQINSDKIRTLSALRDTLLPRLISGQLRLPEAQEQIENA